MVRAVCRWCLSFYSLFKENDRDDDGVVERWRVDRQVSDGVGVWKGPDNGYR